MTHLASVSELVDALEHRTTEIVTALAALDQAALVAPSALAEWTRLTIACHLRYGAQALEQMTSGTLAGDRVAYYPEGRARQRPVTLAPAPGEQAGDVVSGLARSSGMLARQWRAMTDGEWQRTVREPEANPDLGSVTLYALLVLRLTEVEVHGLDLDLGLGDWSDTFIGAALPFRLGWLSSRRANHQDVDEELHGSWLIDASGGPTYLVTVGEDGVVDAQPSPSGVPARSRISGSARDVLALLLGRTMTAPLSITGDVAFGRAFSRAFPGP
jgi:maleylpyruvate isomerase